MCGVHIILGNGHHLVLSISELYMCYYPFIIATVADGADAVEQSISHTLIEFELINNY